MMLRPHRRGSTAPGEVEPVDGDATVEADADDAEAASDVPRWPVGGEQVTLCFPGRNMTHRITNADRLREVLSTGRVTWFLLEKIQGDGEWVNLSRAEVIRFS